MKRTNQTPSGEPTPRRENNSVPAVPGSVPPIREGGTRRFPVGSPNAVSVPVFPPIGGTGDGNREPFRLPAVKNSPRHSHQSHDCGQLILVALDHPRCALTIYTDPWPISAYGEVQALQAGRRTYEITHYGVRLRTAWHITGRPPNDYRTVLVHHNCELIVPEDWKQPPPPKPSRSDTEEVPF